MVPWSSSIWGYPATIIGSITVSWKAVAKCCQLKTTFSFCVSVCFSEMINSLLQILCWSFFWITVVLKVLQSGSSIMKLTTASRHPASPRRTRRHSAEPRVLWTAYGLLYFWQFSCSIAIRPVPLAAKYKWLQSRFHLRVRHRSKSIRKVCAIRDRAVCRVSWVMLIWDHLIASWKDLQKSLARGSVFAIPEMGKSTSNPRAWWPKQGFPVGLPTINPKLNPYCGIYHYLTIIELLDHH